MKLEIAKESGHWYFPDGKPCFEVPYADPRKGMKSPTLADARKLALVPGVTSITSLLAAPGLTNWIIDQNIMAALTLPRHENEPDSEFLSRVKEDGKAKAKAAAERGTALHTDIERAIQGKPHTRHQEHVRAIAAKMEEHGLNLYEGVPEHSFAHPDGYGGKCDYHTVAPAGLCDFKSKDVIEDGKKLVWDEHVIQCGAYREGLGLPTAQCFNIFVGIDDCKVEIIEHTQEELERGWAMFRCLLMLWKLKNRIN